MKIVIFGASGRTGTLLTNLALDAGHKVTAYVRSNGAITKQHVNLNVVVGNLNDAAQLKKVIAGADACISTLGGNSLIKHASEIVSGIDQITTLLESEGVKRFIYLSSLGAGESRYIMGSFVRFFIADIMLRVPLSDHNANEKRIAKSKLQWTLVRPAGLTNGPQTGRLKHGSKNTVMNGTPQISRANVASFMLSQLTDTTYLNKGVWVYG
jgi:putative NADH-flavin reductase